MMEVVVDNDLTETMRREYDEAERQLESLSDRREEDSREKEEYRAKLKKLRMPRRSERRSS